MPPKPRRYRISKVEKPEERRYFTVLGCYSARMMFSADKTSLNEEALGQLLRKGLHCDRHDTHHKVLEISFAEYEAVMDDD